MKISVSDKALTEVDEIYEYYFAKASQNIADRFELEVQARIKYLENFAETGSTVKDSLRRPRNKNRRFVTLDRFPQQIYYYVDVKTRTVYIERVLHHARNIRRLMRD